MLLLLLGAPALANDVLLLGASYVDRNDLELLADALLDEGTGTDRTVEALCDGGLTWEKHVELVSTDSTWATTIVDTPWSAAFLHEFADVADNAPDSEEFLASVAAGQQLGTWFAANGAEVFVWLTWGDIDGGPDYDDYTGMQDGLRRGAEAQAAGMASVGVNAYIVPIGEAFRVVWASEADPLAPEALFYRLYTTDGEHPTPVGSYLAALVIYVALTGNDPAGLAAPAAVEAADVARLQAAALAAVVETAAEGYAYPWQGGDTGTVDTGTVDTGTADSGDSGTGDSGTGDSGTAAEPDTSDSRGCACDSGATALAAPLALAALAARRPRGPRGRAT